MLIKSSITFKNRPLAGRLAGVGRPVTGFILVFSMESKIVICEKFTQILGLLLAADNYDESYTVEQAIYVCEDFP